MKLEAVAAVLIRLVAVMSALKGATGLANLAWIYSKLHHAVESNPQLKQGFHESVKNSLSAGLIAIVFGVICWLISRPAGKWLATGLEETTATTPGA